MLVVYMCWICIHMQMYILYLKISTYIMHTYKCIFFGLFQEAVPQNFDPRLVTDYSHVGLPLSHTSKQGNPKGEVGLIPTIFLCCKLYPLCSFTYSEFLVAYI